jgi:hypothetical protein
MCLKGVLKRRWTAAKKTRFVGAFSSLQADDSKNLQAYGG